VWPPAPASSHLARAGRDAVLPAAAVASVPAGGDLLFGLDERAEGGLGATRLALGVEAVATTSARRWRKFASRSSSPRRATILVLAEGALHQQVELFRRVVAKQG